MPPTKPYELRKAELTEKPGPARLALITLLYFLIAWAYHTATANVFTTLVGGGDSMIMGVSSKIFATSFSSWNPYVGLGQFAYSNVPYQSFYPPSLLIMTFFPDVFGFNLFLMAQYALGGLFCYVYLKGVRLTGYAAFVGGLVFMLCGFLTAHRGHEYIVSAAIWLPLALYFIDRYSERLRLIDLGFASLPVALSILAGFPQIAVYSILIILAYIPFSIAGAAVLEGWKTKLGQGILAASVVLGLGGLLGCLTLLSVAQALPLLTREHLTYEMFAADYLPPWQLLEFLIPNFFGGVDHTVPTYAPNINVVELYPYIGLLPLALALAGLGIRRRLPRQARFWIAAGAAALVLSFGATTPIYRVLFYVPVYNMFRAPARHLFEINLAISIIAATVLDFLLRQEAPMRGLVARSIRRTLSGMALLIAAAMCVAAGLRFAAEILSAPPFSALDKLVLNYYYTIGTAKGAVLNNLAQNGATLTVPFVFFAITAGLLWLLVRKGRRPLMIVLIPAVIIADAYLAEYKIYVYPDMSPANRPGARAEINVLRGRQFDSRHYRAYPVDIQLTWSYPLLNMFYDIPVINDYSPLELKRYRAVTGFSPSGALPGFAVTNYKLFSLLGAQYLIAADPSSIRALDQAPVDAPAEASHVLIAAGAETWANYGASSTGPGGYTLKSRDGTAVSLIQTEIHLKPNTNYEIALVAKSAGDLTRTPLNVDLYALPSYIAEATTRSFFLLDKEYTHHSALLNSGATAPPRVFVRLYTQSPAAIDVRDIRVRELDSAPQNAFARIANTNEGIAVFENRRALPRFRFARHVTAARNLDDAIRLMGQAEFNPAVDVIAEGIPASTDVSPGKFLSERIENTRLEWDVLNEGRSFLVVADSFFPGWKATVDGQPVPIYPVYGCVRGVQIEGAGRHRVVMQFVPWSLYAGLCGTGLGAVMLGFLWFDRNTGYLDRLLVRIGIGNTQARFGGSVESRRDENQAGTGEQCGL